MISDAEYLTRRRYWLRWSLRYSFAGFVCVVASLVAWPNIRGVLALAAGVGFYVCAGRAKRRALEIV